MEKFTDKDRIFSRRAFIIGGIQLALCAGLIARLGYLQLSQGDAYKTLSDKNRIDLRLIPPSRGVVYDRNGRILAMNEQNFRLLITPEQVDNIDALLKEIGQHITLSKHDIAQFKKHAKSVRGFIPIKLKDALDWQEVSKIESNLPDFPGVKIDVGEVRGYTLGPTTAHIIGYVSAVSQADLRKNDHFLKLPGVKIGKTGIEKNYEQYLRGTAGTRKIEVNVTGREVRQLENKRPKNGAPIVLSLDEQLQNYTYERLSRHKSASAIVMDAKTGAIFAMGSHPSFDTNLFTKGLSPQKWQELLSDPTYPLSNKAIAGQYPPGSTFKMITALAALEHGYTSQKRTVFCPGHYELGNDRFHCWKRGGHGEVDLVEALSQSCDVYFYEIAAELGINKIAEMARKIGLGSKFKFDLPEERPGLIPDTNWKIGHIGTKWQQGETVVASIGQGYMQATPLQLAVMTARLVNGGIKVDPWVAGIVGEHIRPRVNWPKMDIDPKNLALIKKGMDRAVNHKKGTAHSSAINIPGFEMGGKTGTSQVRRITARQRAEGTTQESLPWRHRHHALFVGYAPLNNPRYVCATVVEHGIGGSKTAAPLARALLLKAQKLKLAEKPLFDPTEIN